MKILFCLILVTLFAGVEMRVVGSFGCPNGLPTVNCFVDPCTFNHGCIGHPNAVCRANYCGGCNKEFWENGVKLSTLQCS